MNKPPDVIKFKAPNGWKKKLTRHALTTHGMTLSAFMRSLAAPFAGAKKKTESTDF